MSILRSVLLAGSENRWLRERATKYRFVRRAVSRFMPGETFEEALEASHALGVGTVLTQLGENLASLEEAKEVARHYLTVLEKVHESKLDVEISVKPTQLGLDFSPEACFENLRTILERARALGNWVWVDIGGGIRLVKGAYREPPEKAFPEKKDVDENYFRLAQRLLSKEARDRGVRAIFGTHDPILIGRIEEHAKSLGLPPGALEFQMLYGIRRQEQLRVVKEGHRFRVLISYGAAWYPWYMRRLAERPANVLFVLRSLWAR